MIYRLVRLVKFVLWNIAFGVAALVAMGVVFAVLMPVVYSEPSSEASSSSVASVTPARASEPVSEPTPVKRQTTRGAETTELSDLDKTVLHASALCKAVDKSGIATTPCEISGWNSTITVTMVADDSTAHEFCDTATSFVRKGGYHFNAGWELHVVSPYSNGTPIARCDL